MPIDQLKSYLDEHHVKYIAITHGRAYTAQEIAASAHVPGKDLAKTVVVKLEGKLAMAVLPATRKLDLNRLKEASGASKAELADEREFANTFGHCELGAMPPFGNLYDMPVYVASSLAEDDQIAFNAGSHTELVKLAYADFERLVQPTVAPLAM